MSKLRMDFSKYGFCFVFLLWVIIQAVVYLKFDILFSVDSDLYASEAKNILQGVLPRGRSVFYVSYILILAFLQLLNLSVSFVVIVQILFSGAALVAIYMLTASISKSAFTPLVACFLYVICFKIHQWNFIIYTDSLFTSCCIISLSLAHFSRSKMHYLLAILFVIFTVFLRPNGIVLVVSFAVYLFLSTPLSKLVKIGVLAAFTLIIALGLNMMMSYYIDLFIDSYSKAEIIYPNNSLFVLPPDDLHVSDSKTPILKLLFFIGHNFFYFSKLMCIKGFLFLLHVKPYYSILHNLLILLFLIPSYVFAFKGIKKIYSKPIKYFGTSFILLQTITISLTSENWDGRFLFPILPVVFIFASFGMMSFMSGYSYFSRFQK